MNSTIEGKLANVSILVLRYMNEENIKKIGIENFINFFIFKLSIKLIRKVEKITYSNRVYILNRNK